MAQTVSCKADEDHASALVEMTDRGEADSVSEALRETSAIGLDEKGYRNGEKLDTRLRHATRRFADAFGLLGIMWVGFSLWLPLDLRIWAAAPFAAAFACIAIDRLLEAYEPAVTRRIGSLFPGGERA